MKTGRRFSRSRLEYPIEEHTWHNGSDAELHEYAVALQRAARALLKPLEWMPTLAANWDVCPVILLYRQATELQLKGLVGEGSHYLKTPTDALTLSKTRSLRWLAQIVCQIIKKVRAERTFVCEGVTNLKEFSELINELEALDPPVLAVVKGGREQAVHEYQSARLLSLARKWDALLELLDVTTDALADQRHPHERPPFPKPAKPTIH